jgi:HEAT repeat protein
MINKKRQELIIQNLRSISSEVRMKSIEQLSQLPAMPVHEKISHLQVAVDDPEPEVSDLARKTIAQLKGESEAAAKSAAEPAEPGFSFPSIDEMPLTPPDDAPVAFCNPEWSEPRPAPGFPVIEDMPAVATPPVADAPPPSSAASPSQVFAAPTVPSPMPPPASVPPVQPIAPVLPAPQIPQPPRAQPMPPAPFPEVESGLDEFVDDPPDPSLPNLAKITNIPDMLAHIQDLAGNKPSGHTTQLLTMARSGIEEVALTALQALLNLKNARFASVVMKMLAEDQFSSQRRFLMLKIIMESDRPLHVPTLEQILLREKDVIVKSGLVKVYARSSGGQGVATLISCLQDQDARVRANTVEVIEEQNIQGCEHKIVELLQDPENRVKVNAAKYLVKNGYQQAFMTLRNMLVSSEVWLRDSVIFALGEIGDQASLTLLKAALKDPNQGIRLSVLKALARINNNTARQVLKAACGDPDPVVAQVSNSLFERLKNTPIREDIRYTPNASFGSAPSPVQAAQASRPQPPALPAMQQSPLPSVPQSLPPQPFAAPIMPTAPQAPVMPSLSLIPDEPPPFVTPPSAAHPVMPQPPAVPRQPAVAMPPVAPVPPTWSEGPVMPPAAKEPALPELPPVPPSRPAIPGMPAFAKPRSADLYVKLCSDNVDEQRAGSRDIAFILGEDQMLLLNKAVTMADESIRINAVKILSRKKTPDAKALLEKLTSDHNETVRSLAEKALVMLK